MRHPSDKLHSAARAAIQSAILKAPLTQSALAERVGRQRNAVSNWLSPHKDTLPDLVTFLRLRRAALAWGDLSLYRLDMPASWSLTPRQTPPGWRPDRNLLNELARLAERLGWASTAALGLADGSISADGSGPDIRSGISDRDAIQRAIDEMRRWLVALEIEAHGALAGAAGDALPEPRLALTA